MTESEMKLHRCCFKGHRPQKLRRSEKEIKADLECTIQQAIMDGYTTFITGMAYGVDIWAGQIPENSSVPDSTNHLGSGQVQPQDSWLQGDTEGRTASPQSRLDRTASV